MTTKPFYQQTTTPVEQVQRAVEQALSNVNTILPCKVVSVLYPKVTVQPLIQRGYLDEQQNLSYLEFGEIPNIPILTFGNSAFNILMPTPQVNDIGLLLINQSNVSQVYNSGEILNNRKFDFLDGVFVPLYQNITPPATPNTITFNGINITVSATTQLDLNSPIVNIDATTSCTITTPSFTVDGATSITLNTTQFVVQGPTYELLASIILALNAIKTGSTVSGGPFDPGTITAIAAAVTQIQAFT